MVLAVLRRIHRWLGLLLAVPLLIQGVSGAILALAPLLPDLAAMEATKGESRSASAIIAAAQADVPAGVRPARYIPAASPGETALVWFVDRAAPRGRGFGVRIDPVSLATLDRQDGSGVIDWIKALHTNLLTEDRSGRSIIGWVGVGLLALVVVGVVLWWPPPERWREAFTIDPRATGHAFHRRLHGAFGIWSLALLLATAATGVVLAFPQTARGALGLTDPGPRRSVPRGDAPAVDVDQAIAAAMGATHGLRLRAVLLPAGGSDPVRVLLVPPGADGVAATVTVAVDADGRVVSMQDPRAMSSSELALRWVHDLHFGQGFGPVWRGLTIATGLVLPTFAITGGAMWLFRQRRRASSLQPGD